MTTLKSKITEVREFYSNGDHHLGLRRMIDCVLDTGNPVYYKQMIEILETCKDDSLVISNAPSTKSLLDTIDALEINSNIKQDETLFKVNDLQKQYANGNFKMGPVSFELKYKQVIGLVGENGNGKTTLLRLLCKDLEPDNGTIEYSIEKSNPSLYELRSKLIYIPQRAPKWFGSLMDNLNFTLSMHGVFNEENRLLSEMIIARLGLRPYKHLNWNRISSGYRTRFELAKALLRKPEILLLDEPLSNLDIISQQTILQDLKNLSGSIINPFGIILSSQQLYEVEKISDMVIFLKNGEPQYQNNTIKVNEDELEIIYEMETDASRDAINEVFVSTGLKAIQYNGGVYVLHFNSGTSSKTIFNAIAQKDLQVRYIRNISQSSRRFFIH
ncbi:MAG: ABC transporter ATP-binding protein [Bacteroidia bacterium]|nr:ABC transporter ATP-binding protein [Bacteroidia bacterium]